MNDDTDARMKPIIVLPIGEVSQEDIAELRKNGICTIEAKDPSLVRFIEPPPFGYSEQEKAAIELFRVMLRRKDIDTFSRWHLTELWAQILMAGKFPTPIQPAEVVTDKSPKVGKK